MSDPRKRIYRITRCIWLGPYASLERGEALRAAGISHILNVGEAPSVLAAEDGQIREVTWRPVLDLERIPDKIAIDCITHLHRMVCEPRANIYVHCIAGQNRSPTIVWLYLIACGSQPEIAKNMIVRRA